jgi:hypothetical protein
MRKDYSIQHKITQDNTRKNETTQDNSRKHSTSYHKTGQDKQDNKRHEQEEEGGGGRWQSNERERPLRHVFLADNIASQPVTPDSGCTFFWTPW